MNIDEILIKLCELDSKDEMELFLEVEIDRTEQPECPYDTGEYLSELYELYGYLLRGKFRDYKEVYQPLLNKLNELK